MRLDIGIDSQSKKNLLIWYEIHGRDDLPWRQTRDIYHVYLSEIMLQQTQVSRVLSEYYPRFLEVFPTLKTLADTSLDEVFSNWSGLGYYSRARNLHKVAQICRESGLPQNPQELQKLPGIGRYTAHAICSFGYEQDVAVVDTNISRVLRRYFALLDAKEHDVWNRAEEFLNFENSRIHNLALMDLGSLVCSATNPKCEECPLSANCQGKKEPMLYTQKKSTKYENLELFLGVYHKEDRIALIKSEGPMYVGMLELPSIEPIDEAYLDTFKHSYTKYRLQVHLYRSESTPTDASWVALKDMEKAPISSLTKKALEIIRKKESL